MGFFDILLIILILDIAWIIHIFCIKRNWLNLLNIPLSEGLFWKNKTWRGLIVMSLFSGIIAYPFFGFWYWILLWLLWILWELPNSFIKRRMSIVPWGHAKWIFSLLQYCIDTLDSVLIITIYLSITHDFSLSFTFWIIWIWFLNHSLLDILSYKSGIKKLNFPNPLIIFFQIFVWLFFRLFHYFFGQRKMFSIRPKNGNMHIFIANHISKLDPFLMCTSIDFSSTIHLIPYRFMVSPSYVKKPIIYFLLQLVGWYPAYLYDEDGKNQSLKISKKFLERWETMVIFPEGWIHKKKFWVGAFYLNQHLKNSYLHLFHIEKKHKKYSIDYIWTDSVKNYPIQEDLLLIWNTIFSKIKKNENIHW